MGINSNIIPLNKYRDRKKPHRKHNTTNGSAVAEVTDLSARREAIIKRERRNVKRTVLNEFVGFLVLIPGMGLQKCALRDISEEGLSFDLESRWGSFAEGEQVSMRVYLNHRTYFTFLVQVGNTRYMEDEDVYRHGGTFIPDTINEVALYHFIKFIETVSTNLRADNGDVLAVSSGDNT
jgi:hypothetical protein